MTTISLEESLNVLEQLKQFYLASDPDSDTRAIDKAISSIVAWKAVRAEIESELQAEKDFMNPDYAGGLRRSLSIMSYHLSNVEK